MDVFDSLLETLEQHRTEVLKVSYALFLEQQKPQEKIDYRKIEKLAFQKRRALESYAEYCNVTDRVWSKFTIGSEIHEYIKGKGHKPRRIYGFPFYIACVLTVVPLIAILSLEDGFVLVLLAVLAIPFWLWWYKSETFEPKVFS